MTEAIETRSITQLGRLVAVPANAIVPVQVEGAPAGGVPVEALFGKYLSTAVSYETAAELLADLDHDDRSVALVYADPDPDNSIYWVKDGASGGGAWIKTNIGQGLKGDTGPANSTYSTTAALEAAAVANVSAILAETGKAGTFTIRDYADFMAQVAADTSKLNFIRSTANPAKVWVRNTILSTVIVATESLGEGAWVNVYSSGGNTRVRNASGADPDKFANGFVLDAVANGAAATVTFFGLNAKAVVPAPVPEVWLSDVTPGGNISSPPTNAGSIIQSLGPAIPGLGVFFTFRERVLLS